MKRLLLFISTLLCANVLMAQTTFWIGDIQYEITSTNPAKVEVNDANSSITTANIPSTVSYEGTNYSVTSIGNWAFEFCSSLTSVTLPNSVTSIGQGAFYDCSSLTSITIPNSVTYIGGYAFSDCRSLTSITIPNSVTSIGYWAFSDCRSLTSVTIPNSVTSIESGAFSDCSSLTSVTIPNSVTSIIGEAFRNCSSLTSVTCLAETAPSLGNNVFSSTPSTKVLNIPCGSNYSSWESATTWASVECIDVNLGNGLTYFPLTFAIISEGERTMKVSDCNVSATDVEIPARVIYNGVNYCVTSIGNDAFELCSSLTSVTIPNSVTSIGSYAFEDCSSLTSVTIPNSVTSIGNNAFYYCHRLTSVTCLAETAPSLGSSVFSYTPSNKTLTVPFDASGYTSDWGNATWQKIYHKINEGEIKTLTNAFEITEDNKRGVINEGVLRITQNGQLINQTSTNVGGIIEIETPTLANDKWSFIGAPFAGYKIKAVKPGSKDVAISLFDYTTGNWAENFATIEDSVGSGEGFFAWSFAAEPTVFTTYGDGAETYNFETTPAYSLNDDAVNVTKNLTTHTEGCNWLALSNPYTFKLDVEKFLSEHGDIKGGVVYRFNGSVWTPVSEGEINMTEGFFVNFENPGTHSVSFSKYYIYEPSKSKALEAKDYITLNLTEGENVSKLRFAQNPKAKQGDDIFDANKLFSPLEITEPYFVTDGVA